MIGMILNPSMAFLSPKNVGFNLVVPKCAFGEYPLYLYKNLSWHTQCYVEWAKLLWANYKMTFMWYLISLCSFIWLRGMCEWKKTQRNLTSLIHFGFMYSKNLRKDLYWYTNLECYFTRYASYTPQLPMYYCTVYLIDWNGYSMWN